MSIQKPTNINREPVSDDPADDAIPIDQVAETAVMPTDPPVETALDDDEGGADPIDPDTGLPYENKEPGAAMPLAERQGGEEEG